jgi:hypothetical protein
MQKKTGLIHWGSSRKRREEMENDYNQAWIMPIFPLPRFFKKQSRFDKINTRPDSQRIAARKERYNILNLFLDSATFRHKHIR